MSSVNGGDGSDQPRPALGLRPWFAFVRRALRLRRFDLAMGAHRNSAAELVRIASPAWEGGAVEVATSVRRRLGGLRPVAGPIGLLMEGGAVHTVGMRDTLLLVGMDSQGLVRGVRHVAPNRLARFPSARWILELGPAAAPPQAGDRLMLMPILEPWPAR